MNVKHKEVHDKLRYENAYRSRRCRIRFSGGDDSIDTETRNNMMSYGITWSIVPVVLLTVVLPATLAVVINYLYWRPRNRVR